MQRSDGRGSFQAVDKLNGKLLCGCDDVNACVVRCLLLKLIANSQHNKNRYYYGSYV